MIRASSHHWSFRAVRFLFAPIAFAVMGSAELAPVPVIRDTTVVASTRAVVVEPLRYAKRGAKWVECVDGTHVCRMVPTRTGRVMPKYVAA